MNTINHKILVVISSYQQYHTYVRSRALEMVKNDVVFIIEPQLAKMDFGVCKNDITQYAYSDKKNILHRHIFNINTYINRRKHNAFWVRTQLFTSRQKRIYQILSLPILSDIVKYIFLKLAEDKTLNELIKQINPSIILLPSHAFEGITFELIRIARRLKIPSFMIAENWDTLATKTIFTIKPDYLGVWSEQQVDHAVNIRGMKREKVIILGTPRFTGYFNPESRNQSSPYPFKYALYAGMADFFNEIGALKRLDEIIDRLKLDLKIVYRPTAAQHTRSCPDVFFEYDFKHVVLDTAAQVYYKKSASWDISKDGFNPIYFPDHSYYPKLLSNMEFMICAHSTMILEAAIFDKKTYLLAYDDGLHRFGPHWIYKQGRHLTGVERLSNVRMVYNINDMEKIFTSGDQLKISVDPISVDYFISRDATANYAKNLKKQIDNILSNSRLD